MRPRSSNRDALALLVVPAHDRRHGAGRLAATGETFTSEDVTAKVGQPPSSGAVGARINAAAKRGLIEHVGYTKARRANQHGAELRTWRGVNR